MSEYLKIFSCCHIAVGAERASVYDTQRKQIYFLPLSLVNLIDKEKDFIAIEKYRKELDKESLQIFEEYIEFLLENEIGFLCEPDEVIHFPKMGEYYLFPAHINEIIIDSDAAMIPYLDESFLIQLEKLCCNYIQFRFFKPVRKSEIQKILHFINPTQIKAIELIFPWDCDFEELKAQNFIQKNRKVRNLILTSAPYNKIVKQEDYLDGAIIFSETRIENNLHCGIVQSGQFVLNITHYTESLHHNTCLNRKIAIDADGNIKNCPSMKESYGNIRDTTLEEAINKPGFKKYWNITKDMVTKCKDCEFRHVCTDCRAYIDDPHDIYSAPLKCGYDPYTCEWEEWSTHPMKQKAIDYYGMREILNNDK